MVLHNDKQLTIQPFHVCQTNYSNKHVVSQSTQLQGLSTSQMLHRFSVEESGQCSNCVVSIVKVSSL